MPFWTPQDPQFSLRNFQEDLNRLMERVWHSGVSMGPFDGQEWAPPVDLYEHAEHYTLYVEVAGIDPGTVEVSYVGDSLTVRGIKETPAGVNEQSRPIRRERRFGAFCRTIALPGGIDADRLAAKCNGGVLEITVPKTESSRAKAVKIEVESG